METAGNSEGSILAKVCNRALVSGSWLRNISSGSIPLFTISSDIDVSALYPSAERRGSFPNGVSLAWLYCL